MKNPYRGSLLLALVALLLMAGADRLVSPGTAPAAASTVLLGEADGLRLFAGETPPEGVPTFFDRETLYAGSLLYVSPDAPLPAWLPEPQTRDVRGMVHLYIPAEEHVSLSEETIYALCRLVKENPLSGVRIAAGMRSPREQQALQDEAFAVYRQTMPVAGAIAQAEADVPASGCCEHQLSTAFDIRFSAAQEWGRDDPMARTADGRWLLKNAWRYGFIRRYPPDKAEVTGVKNETTHWRYVGRDHAAAMHAAGFCLEEYLRALHESGALRLLSEEGEEVWLLCGPLDQEGAAFPIPQGWRAEVSADNLGWAVCAMKGHSSR